MAKLFPHELAWSKTANGVFIGTSSTGLSFEIAGSVADKRYVLRVDENGKLLFYIFRTLTEAKKFANSSAASFLRARGDTIKNPVYPIDTPAKKRAKAVKLFSEFTGHDATYEEFHKFNLPKVTALVGKLVSVTYEATRDGEKAHYKHDFAPRARPLLVVSDDGNQLLIVGGSYVFKESGING
jgi:hypothetical protein